jgi:hypothetical protein
MVQKMLYCFAHNSPEILPHVLGYSFCIKHHILAGFCLMLLRLKATKIIGAKTALFWCQKC